MIEEITDKKLSRFDRLAEERYDALCNTIAHLYGQAFLDELEANVDGIISRTHFTNTIQDRLGLLRRQYRTKCKVETSEQRLVDKAFYYVTYSAKDRKRSEKYALNKMWLRSKARQRYNALKRVIAIDFGDDKAKELVWKAAALALADVTNKLKYRSVSEICGICKNDKSYELHHMRDLYAYTKALRQDIYGTHIHNLINSKNHS